MFAKMFRSRKGTAEIVGTVLFLVILFFFFSNVFLWHNQKAKEMDNLMAEKTNSAVRLETTVLTGTPVTSWVQHIEVGYSVGPNQYNATWPYDLLIMNCAFNTGIDTSKEMLIADLRLSIYASFVDSLYKPCFVSIFDYDQGAWVDTGLTVIEGYRWANTTLLLPKSYVDGGGNVIIRIADVSSQSIVNETGTLYIGSMEVCADLVALELTNLGGSDSSLSRLWIVDSTSHTFLDLEPLNIWIPAGSHRNIVFTPSINAQDILISYAPPDRQTVTFRVLTTLGNTAACSYSFP
jgi:hypothetical protein